MKKKKLLILLALPIAALLVAACEMLTVGNKEDMRNVPLPPETQEGKNTFGCYVDGVSFVPETTVGGIHPLTTLYRLRTGYFNIAGIDGSYYGHELGNNTAGGLVSIHKKGVLSCGEYSLTPDCENDTCSTGSYSYETWHLINSGELVIVKLDTVTKIISGRFYFTTRDGNKVTDGRFDAKYSDY
jgi:hypothetical protein